VWLTLCKSSFELKYLLISSNSYFRDSPLRNEIPYDELRVLGLLPWFHSYGCMSLINMLSTAIQIVHIPKFEEVLFLSSIEKYRINCIFMVPPLMVFVAKSPLVLKYDLSSLRMLHSGAAPLSKEVEDAVRARLPNLESIRQGYGMSETTLGVLSQSASDKLKPGSVGAVVRGISVKVVDPETGKILGPNQRGELCFKGTQIMMGYIGDGKETSLAFDADGYLRTGDVGFYDEDQQFFIVDRLKELIKYKGFQVPPAELEGVILENPKVKDAAVIGVPDERSGELPMAFIVKQDGVEVTAKEIIDYVAKRSSPAKRLHGGVRFIDAIPKNPSGKILRKDLRVMLKESKAKL
jgi:4-coumarate--CoA ligase